MHILSKFTYLVVEDDEPKLGAILTAIREIDEYAIILVGGSVASGIDLISKEKVDFAILDMSLPAFDFATDMSGGGQPQGFGGRDILRFLEDLQPNAQALVITQYEEFNSDLLNAPQRLSLISKELHDEFGKLLIDVIHYSGQRGKWKESLKLAIKNFKEGM